ncbi:hypothetical protein [Paenibacillus sp. YAF4_2]|uniref:hypothetical protein n=1 Tax=Paenibacillus sp. YAF4_2 TaxID=3233085 RepID=UPI003F9582A0
MQSILEQIKAQLFHTEDFIIRDFEVDGRVAEYPKIDIQPHIHVKIDNHDLLS